MMSGSLMTKTNIPVTFYNELKPGDVNRTVEEDGLRLVLLNGKSLGVEVAIVNEHGKLYLVSRQAVMNDKRQELHNHSERR